MDYGTPRHHLFEKLGLDPKAQGTHPVGKGVVLFTSQSPAALTHRAEGADQVRGCVREAMRETGVTWRESNAFVLRRGPYVIAAGLGDRDDASRGEPVTLTGRFIPLFDAELPVIDSLKLVPGTRALLVDLDRTADGVGVVAAACRTRHQTITDDAITFDADGLPGSIGVVALKLDKAPQSVSVDGEALPAEAHDFADGVLRIRFTNQVEPVRVTVRR
jgi:hypothetical protein